MENEIKNPLDEEVNKVLSNEDLLSKIEEQQKKIEMLLAVADKGRMFSYEAGRAEKKPIKIKLGVYNEKVLIGWRTTKDVLVKHPTTGLTVGEEQEFEVLLLDKDGKVKKEKIIGYPAFSNARYTERIEAEVIGKKEDWDGNVTFDLKLPDGRDLSLDARFVN